MPFQKGRAKTGGKKKGYINKLAATVREKLEELGCDPIEGMARIALDEKNAIEVRVKCQSELANYIYPKRKAVEHSGPGGSSIAIDVSGTQLLTSRIAGIAARRGTGGGDQQPH